MAWAVMDENHARFTGFSRAFFGAVSRMSLKMSSPSRPASHALTITSTSSDVMYLWSALSCLPAFTSRAWYLNAPGMMGRSSYFHFL